MTSSEYMKPRDKKSRALVEKNNPSPKKRIVHDRTI